MRGNVSDNIAAYVSTGDNKLSEQGGNIEISRCGEMSLINKSIMNASAMSSSEIDLNQVICVLSRPGRTRCHINA